MVRTSHIRVPSCIAGILLALPLLLSAQEKKPLTFEQIYRNGEPRLIKTLPFVTGWADDSHYIQSKGRGEGSVLVDAGTGKESPYHDLSAYTSLVDSTININSPASSTEDFRVLVYEHGGDLYVLDTRTKTFRRLTTTAAEEKNPTLSPDGKWVAYTRDNNLFTIDLGTGKETQLTTDGTDVVYNGWASWVYYEEIFGRPSHYRAFWWSPDSRRLAFYRFDDSRVPVFDLFNADGQHGSIEKTHYPEAGDPNPEVRIGFVSPGGGEIRWAEFNPADDQYFGTPFWTPDGKSLWVQWMNRGQDDLKIYGVDPATGGRKEVYEERQSSWVDWFEQITFLKDNKGFILMSDKDGWMHLYLYNHDGSLRNRITEGDWSVTALDAVDEARGELFFSARKENSTRTDLYRVRFDGSQLRRLTFGEYSHSVKVSPGGSYFVTSYSNVATPTREALCDRDGKVVRELGDSKTAVFDEYAVAKTELFRVTTSDGYALPVTWTLPTHFDKEKKYPVLISIYGGPNAGTVYDRWGGLRDQWLAQEGMILVSMDHRGSGHFGKKGVALMHRCLGKWEMHDYIEVVQWLRTHPFVDSTRICITGGSYGGYVTCMALTAGADYFNYGVADFSVTDWKLYDTHYTERYMDTPAENPEGYKEGAVLTYVKNYKGVLMISHGTLDDNVHMQNSIQLISALEDLGKHFEFMAYPNERHGWGGPKGTFLRNETMRFYYRYLLQKPFPAELFSKPGIGRRPF
jgi:dipeptidyl-peptidase-4